MILSYTKSFTDDVLKVPNDLRTKVTEGVDLLQDCYPLDRPEASEETALANIFLLPIATEGDWVIVYEVSKLPDSLDLYMLGKRSDILNRLRLKNPDTPNPFLKYAHPGLLKKSPTPDQQTTALIEGRTPSDQNHDTKYNVTDEYLRKCDIPNDVWHRLRGKWTIGELLAKPLSLTSGDVTNENITKLIQLVRPTPIEEIEGQPKYVLNSTNELSEPKRLQEWMLKLDPGQKKIVEYFENTSELKGEWSVTGGPGTGKTVLTLHVIHALLNKPNGARQKILFTSYTNAVVDAASALLDDMLSPSLRSNVTCMTIHKIAGQYTQMRASAKQYTNKIKDSINQKHQSLMDIEDLVETEIIWSIIDNGCETIAEYYSNANRKFDKKTQDMIWEIYKEIEEDGLHSFHERISDAAQNAPNSGEYDFVFYDEAQDVQKSGVKLAKKIAKDKNVFIAADENQSIFAPRTNFWDMVKSFFQLDVRAAAQRIARAVGLGSGKTWNLTTNHRCTTQISDAIKDIVSTLEIKQLPKDWIGKTTKNGARPVIARCNDDSEAYEIIENFIKERTTANKLGLPSAYVLCDRKTYPNPNKIANELHNLNARAFKARDFVESWKHEGVKTCWIQSCKGLDLPVVVLFGMTNGNWAELFDKSENLVSEHRREHAERVLLTGLSRTASDLLIITYNHDEPEFIDDLDENVWHFIN